MNAEGGLQAENARLAEENQKINAEITDMDSQLKVLRENASLREENARLKRKLADQKTEAETLKKQPQSNTNPPKVAFSFGGPVPKKPAHFNCMSCGVEMDHLTTDSVWNYQTGRHETREVKMCNSCCSRSVKTF